MTGGPSEPTATGGAVRGCPVSGMSLPEWRARRAARNTEWIVSVEHEDIRCPGWLGIERHKARPPEPCGHRLGRAGDRTTVMVRWKRPGQKPPPVAMFVQVSNTEAPSPTQIQFPTTTRVEKCPECYCQIESVFAVMVDEDTLPKPQGPVSGGHDVESPGG
jgi:hypothetical protein